jgi:hypothetical protein
MSKRKLLVFTFLLLSKSIIAQDIGLGLRLGDPVAISFKKYLKKGRNAVEFNIGSYGYMYGYGSYNNGRYNGRYRYYGDYYYRQGGVVIMGDYLWHKPLSKAKEVSVYVGVGGQLRTLRYLKDDDRNGFYDDEVSGIGIGPEGVVGIEWIPRELPEIGVFLDARAYLEIVPQPWLVPQVGLGVRYNFK